MLNLFNRIDFISVPVKTIPAEYFSKKKNSKLAFLLVTSTFFAAFSAIILLSLKNLVPLNLGTFVPISNKVTNKKNPYLKNSGRDSDLRAFLIIHV
jgi:hypothetical protein